MRVCVCVCVCVDYFFILIFVFVFVASSPPGKMIRLMVRYRHTTISTPCKILRRRYINNISGNDNNFNNSNKQIIINKRYNYMHNYNNNNIRFFSSASNDDDNDSASNNKVGYTSLSSTVHNDKNLPLAEEEGLANNVKEQMINKLYNAHLEHDDEMKLNLLSYYINGMDSIEDPLLGDLETKSFFYEVAAHSLPQGNAWNNMKNLETSIKLFKKFCKYDEGKFDIEFTNSDICLLMATELFELTD